MKRFLPILLSLLLILALCACSDKEQKTTEGNSGETQEQVTTNEGGKDSVKTDEENKGPIVEPPTGGDSDEIGSLPIFPGQSSTSTTTTKKGTPTSTTKKDSTTTTTTKKNSTTTTTKKGNIELPPVPLN